MLVEAIRCKKCKEIIYSRARHDMRWCFCGAIAINGGRDYMKITANSESDYERVLIDLPDVTKKELYDDWKKGKDKYGKYEGPKNKVKFS